MVNGSVVRPSSVMDEKESMEAFSMGCARAASAARELAKECQNPEWDLVASTLEAMHRGGKQLADMKAMSKFETAMALNMKANPIGFLN